jgi:hypothetical protein
MLRRRGSRKERTRAEEASAREICTMASDWELVLIILELDMFIPTSALRIAPFLAYGKDLRWTEHG